MGFGLSESASSDPLVGSFVVTESSRWRCRKDANPAGSLGSACGSGTSSSKSSNRTMVPCTKCLRELRAHWSYSYSVIGGKDQPTTVVDLVSGRSAPLCFCHLWPMEGIASRLIGTFGEIHRQ